MTAITVALLIVLIGGACIGVYAWPAPRRVDASGGSHERPPMQATTDWTHAAGDEFAGLSESARCDLIFAVAALGDERSQKLLEHALSDPAEAVSLAAAHALVSSGRASVVEAFLERYPGDRAQRLTQTLALLDK